MWRAVKSTKRLIVFAIARLLLLLSGVYSFHTFGVVNLGIEQGLPQSSVGDIIQGPQDFMWFATNDGVARYDGSRFKNYQATSENQRPVKRFTQLLVSRDGVLFAMGENQLFYYDLSLDSLQPVLHTESQKPIKVQQNGGVSVWQNTLIILQRGQINQLSIFSLYGVQVTQRQTIPLAKTQYAQSVLVNPDGDMYLVSKEAILWVSTEEGEVKDITPTLTAPYVVFERLYSGAITLLGRSARWCLKGPALINCGEHNFDFSPIYYSAVSDTPVVIEPYDKQTRFLISYGSALYMLDANYKRVREYSSEQDEDTYLPNNDIGKLYIDNQNNIWISTYGAGVNLIASKPGLIVTVSKQGDKSGLSHNHVRSFWEDRQANALWVGTFDGLNRVDLLTHGVQSFFPPFDTLGRFFIRGIHGYHGRLLLMLSQSFQGSMFWLFDPSTNQWESLEPPAGLVETEGVFTSFLEQDKLWIAFVTSGLYYVDLTSQSWHRADFFGDNNHVQHIQSLYVDNNDNLYIGSTKGALFYNPHIKQLSPFGGATTGELSNQWTRSFLQSQDGTLWIGTNAGLNQLAANQTGLKLTGVHFKSDTIYGIVEDAKQRLWLSTNEGIVAFDPSTTETVRFKHSDGLQSNEFNTGAYAKLIDGTIAFGGVGGMNLFDPDTLLNYEPQKLPLQVVGLKVLNEHISYANTIEGVTLNAPLSQLTELSVQQDLPAFSIDLALLQFSENRNITYEYKVEELSDVWLSLDGERAYFTGLPEGRFNVSFRALSAGGAELGRKSILLSVVPPFWRSGPAIAMYLLVVSLIAFEFYRRRINFHKRQTLRLQRAVAERTKALNNALTEKNSIFNHISHEFRTPLTLINGLVRELQQAPQNDASSKALLGIKRQGSRLLTLVNQLLAMNSKQPTDTPDAACDASQVVQPVVDVFEVVARQQGLMLKAVIQPGVWCRSSAADIETITTNLLSNAVKYSSPDKNEQRPAVIQLTLSKKAEQLVLQVVDAGDGIARTELSRIWEPFYRSEQHGHIEGTGLGLPLVKSLVDKYDGSVRAYNVPTGGGCFECQLPVTAPQVECVGSENNLRSGVNEEHSLAVPDISLVHRTKNSSLPYVLIVEDNNELGEYLLRTLSHHYNCILAKDGLKALEAVAERQPDVIVSDVMMPNMDGFALCQAIKTEVATSHIPFILLTAKSDYDSRIEGLSYKANVYLSKPFEAEELLLHIRNLTDQLKKLKLHYQQGLKQSIGIDSSVQVSERTFSEKLDAILDKYYASNDFDPPALAEAMALSERQLQRKLKALADCTPSQFIRTRRLEKSKLMLLSGVPVGNVAFDCGFSSQAYFTKCFRETFDLTPSQFIESNSEIFK